MSSFQITRLLNKWKTSCVVNDVFESKLLDCATVTATQSLKMVGRAIHQITDSAAAKHDIRHNIVAGRYATTLLPKSAKFNKREITNIFGLETDVTFSCQPFSMIWLILNFPFGFVSKARYLQILMKCTRVEIDNEPCS